MQHPIPLGDVLIHAGDFTTIGKLDEVKKFSEFLKTLDDRFHYKVVIAGGFFFDYSSFVKFIKLKL